MRLPPSWNGRSSGPEYSNELPRELFAREDIYTLELERLFRGPIMNG